MLDPQAEIARLKKEIVTIKKGLKRNSTFIRTREKKITGIREQHFCIPAKNNFLLVANHHKANATEEELNELSEVLENSLDEFLPDGIDCSILVMPRDAKVQGFYRK